ncbi:hypothetical protein KUTeg_020041 [Tegillarca granosa]|uniref:Uncharacterized protein n=1 Tax=Tegillarca granosa TaxID=220873 RepID=A0ABQ9EJS7_TEGGR|nr:hypothetical protein KUTeg_020041 [Tegillarca granosa]
MNFKQFVSTISFYAQIVFCKLLKCCKLCPVITNYYNSMSVKGLKLILKPEDGTKSLQFSPANNTPPGTPKKRFNFASLAQKVMEQKKIDSREKEKNELKTKIEELEEFKAKYEQEKKENEQLQQKIDQSLLSQSDTSKALFRSNELVERLRADNKKKTEQIEKFQSTISHMEDRMRNLEIRASEVEKAELILETTKQNLESTQTQVRARDGEIRRLTKEYEDKTKQLEYANEKIKSLDDKIEDLKFQVRHELMKNENIEKKEIEEKTALLTAARKAVREYKDQTRDYEKTTSDVDHLQNELEVTRYEVNTLKKLMIGKDHLVSQKSKALDLAKEVIQTMQCSANKEQTEKIVRWIDKIGTAATERPKSPHNKMKPYATIHHIKEIDVSRPPYSSDPDCIHHNGKSERPMSGNTFPMRNHSDESRPKTAVVRPTINKSASFKEHSPSRGHSAVSRWHSQKVPNSASKKCENSPKYTSDTKSSKFSPSLDYVIGANNDHYGIVDSEDRRNCQLVKRTHSENSISDSISTSSDITEAMDDDTSLEYVQMLSKLSPKEKDQIISNFVCIGDRLVIQMDYTRENVTCTHRQIRENSSKSETLTFY